MGWYQGGGEGRGEHRIVGRGGREVTGGGRHDCEVCPFHGARNGDLYPPSGREKLPTQDRLQLSMFTRLISWAC